MKPLISSKDCFSCTEICCYVPIGDEGMSPRFTKETLSLMSPEEIKTGLFSEVTENVYQPSLVISKKENGFKVCPFFDEDSKKCTVYDKRPLECSLWPLLISRSKSGKSIQLRRYRKNICPAWAKAPAGIFEKYIKYLKKNFDVRVIKTVLKNFGGIALEYDGNTHFIKTLIRKK